MSALESKPYDHALRALSRLLPESLLCLLGEQMPDLSQLEPISSREVSLKREVDALYWLGPDRGEKRDVLHGEFEAIPPADLPQKVMVYNVGLRAVLPSVGRIRSVVFLLRAPAAGFQPEYRETHPSGTTLFFRFEVVRLYEFPAQQLANVPFTAALTPLGAGFSEDNRGSLLRKARQSMLALPDPQRAEAQGALALLAVARNVPRRMLYAIFDEAEVRMSSSYLEFIQPDLDKARAEAREEGREEGREEAEQRALQEARQRMQQMVALKFPNRSNTDQSRLTAAIRVATKKTLDTWTLRMLTVDSIDTLLNPADD
ncbi:MAG: hypothetical protein AAFV53_15935 [Myxococcota bacterium]